MLAFKIKDKIDAIEYLIYLDNSNSSLSYYGISFHNKKVKAITKNTLTELYNKFFKINNKCKFLKNENNYDIYFDKENNLYHYMKDNNEDLLMFLIKNSESAVLHEKLKNNDKSDKDRCISIEAKTFNIIGNITLIFVLLTSSIGGIKVNNNNFPVIELQDQIPSSATKNISVDSIRDMIYSSKRLKGEEKDFLYNYELLSDVVPYYQNTSMIFIMNYRLDNYGIKYDELKDGSAGLYYYTNEMCVLDMFKDVSISDGYKLSVVGHEFVHTLQAKCYMYLMEASAETISSEYFNRDAYSYQEACFNFKLLIETLGPEVVWNYIFSGDDSEFDKLLRDNLSESDYNSLINELKLSPFDGNPDHELITNLIHKLYKNMYNQDIMDNHDIYAFNGTYIDKTYFKNQSQGMDIIITDETAKAIDLEIAEFADLYEYKKEINKEEFYKYLNQWHSIHYYKDNNDDSYDLILAKEGVDVSSYYDKESNKIIVRENTDFKEYDFSKEGVDELARDYKLLYCVRTVNKEFDCRDMEGRKIASILISKNSDYICQGADIIYHVKSMEERFPNQSVNKENGSSINVSDNSFTK